MIEMTASVLISGLSLIIAVGSLIVSIVQTADARRTSQRALEVAHEFRADPLKEAVYSSVIEGMQEILEVTAEVLKELDYFEAQVAAQEYGQAHDRLSPKMRKIDALRTKWLALLPTQFVQELDIFRSALKKWLVATKRGKQEGVERAAKIEDNLRNHRSNMVSIVRDIASASHLLDEVEQIIQEDRASEE